MVSLSSPWYQWPGIDFFSEILMPGEITDRRYFHIKMRPQQVVSQERLIADAERLKAIAHSNGLYRVDSSPTTSPGTSSYDSGTGSFPFPAPPMPQSTETGQNTQGTMPYSPAPQGNGIYSGPPAPNNPSVYPNQYEPRNLDAPLNPPRSGNLTQ
jgi:hypothetical protein